MLDNDLSNRLSNFLFIVFSLRYTLYGIRYTILTENCFLYGLLYFGLDTRYYILDTILLYFLKKYAILLLESDKSPCCGRETE